MESPIVSIILPTYNGARFIAGAIESVLKQSFQSWELIVIVDGSSDDTKEIVESYMVRDQRIVFMENGSNKGIQKTLNEGLQKARGIYIARLDDDDRWIDTDKLSKQVEVLNREQGIILVGTDAVVVDTEGKHLSYNAMPKTDQAIRRALLSKNCFLHPTVMFRKNAVEKVEGYSESNSTRHAEDYELWLRLGTVGLFANLPDASTALTTHGKSLTHKNRVIQANHLLRIAWHYRKEYPHQYIGIAVSTIRLVFFALISLIPFPEKLFYSIQKIYKQL